MLRAVTLALAVALGAAGAHTPALASGDAAALLTEADRVFYTHEFENARGLLTRALAAGPDAKQRVGIEIRLATLSWRVFGDVADARTHLAAAEAAGASPSDAPAERARMETHLGDFAAGRAAAKRSLAAAGSASELIRAKTAFARAVLEEALAARLEGDGKARRPDLALVREALALVRPLVAAEPGILEPSRLEVGLALLAGDGSAALEGWRSYFRISASTPPGRVLAGPAAELGALLPRWTGARSRTSARVAAALAASRFFEEATLTGAATREVDAYARFTRHVRDLTDEYYRQTALGHGDWGAYQARSLREAESAWREFAWRGAAPQFTFEAFEKEVDARFGTLINAGETAGYRDLHMGHRVVDEAREVTQYGHTAKIRFVALDSMISNGFQSWAWDGRAQHGGWASDRMIVQVRPAYADGAPNAWRQMTDPHERGENERDVARDTAGDDAKAAANPTAFLPGLAGRLVRQGQERLVERLRARGLRDNALRLAFLSAYQHADVESSIFAHEGRHAIDKTLGETFTPADLEFRAKLSQVVFAPEPRLTLGGIFDANIGDASPHGQANERIMKGLVAWMEAHASEIAGLDRSRPLLPQFDRLSDEQIRTAFASMDPMGKA